MDLENLQMSCYILFLFISFTTVCLSYSAKIFVEHPKGLWVKNVNYNGRGGEMTDGGEMGPVPNPLRLTDIHRLNSAPSSQEKKCIVFLFK